MEPAHYRILRFKKVGKEEFDFKAEDVFVKKGSLKQMKQKIDNQAQVAKLSNSNLNQYCNDCQKDTYHQKLQSILFYLFMGFSNKTPALFDQKEIHKYRFQKCDHGTYHLWKNKKRVLMCKQSFKLVSEVHGVEHLNPFAMKNIIKKDFNVDIESIDQFIDQFPFHCDVCSRKSQMQKKLNDPIWRSMKKENKEQILRVIHQLKQQKRFNYFDCRFNNCQSDQYDAKFQQIIGCFLHKELPGQKNEQSMAGYKRRMQRVISMVKKCDVRKCIKGTYHLWFSNNFQRVLMENQKNELIRIVHQKNHMSKEHMLEKLLEQKNIYINNIWKGIRNIVERCRQCEQKGRVKLNRYDSPIHEQNKQHKQKKVAKFDRIEHSQYQLDSQYYAGLYRKIKQYLKNVPLLNKIQQKDIADKFNIGQSASQFVMNQMIWYNQSQEQVIKLFEHEGLFVKPIVTILQNIIIYKGFLFYTEKMKTNYLQYGDCLNINFMNQVFKKRTAHGPRFQCFLLTGQDQNLQNVLFAIAVVDNDEIANYSKLFQTFFQEMGGQIPRSVVTENQTTSTKSLQKFQEYYNIQFPIILSWYTALKQAKELLEKQRQRDKILGLFAQNLVTTNLRKKEQNQKYIKTIIAEQEIHRRLKYFQLKSSLLNIPSQFIGFSQSTVKKCLLVSLFNQNFISSLNLADFGLSVMKFQQAINSKKQQKEIQTEFSVLPSQIRPIFQDLQPKFSPFIILLLLQQIAKSYHQIRKIIKLKQDLPSLTGFHVQASTKQTEGSYGRQLGYIIEQIDQSEKKVIFMVEHDHWSCSCKYQYVSGLPCFHMMPIVLEYGSLQYYINKRWEKVKQEGKRQIKRQWVIPTKKRRRQYKGVLELFQPRDLFDKILERARKEKEVQRREEMKHKPIENCQILRIL